MKLTDADVRKMSNLTDWKLREIIKQFNGKIRLNEIIDKATMLQQEAVTDNDVRQTQKYDDLIESIFVLQKQLSEKSYK